MCSESETKKAARPAETHHGSQTSSLTAASEHRAAPAERIEAATPGYAGAAARSAPPHGYAYSVKLICGVQPDCGCECAPVQPGKYATAITIHNYSSTSVEVVKRFVPVVLASAPIGRAPRVAGVRSEEKIVLPPRTAAMDDCCHIARLLLGGPAPAPIPLTIGVLEITASAEISVAAIYTASDPKSGGSSLSVEQITGRRL